MEKLTEMCLVDIKSKLQRVKIETLVTIHVHQIDLYLEIQEAVKQQKIKEVTDFDWTKNTRIEWNHEKEDICISITDVNFVYSYEYLGAKERLCITALTDRCYITLS